MTTWGIDRIALAAPAMVLDLADLASTRGADVAEITGDMALRRRGVPAPWEDVVTLAVDAGQRVLDDDTRRRIRLLLVATESGPDQEKAASTWVQRYLGLGDDVRSLEVKHACWAGSAALQLAVQWLVAEDDPEARALVICSDLSRPHFGKPYEFVMGAGAVAMVVGPSPAFLALDRGLHGLYTQEVSDLIRPTPHVEAGHSETSLLSYLDGVDLAFARYAGAVRRRGGPALDSTPAVAEWWPRLGYHAPFGGITRRAHRALLRSLPDFRAADVADDYAARVSPSLAYNAELGGTYAGSVFVSLLGWADAVGDALVGSRVGVYSYGSGSTSEWWSGTFGPGVVAEAARAATRPQLARRAAIGVAQYEAAERLRVAAQDDGEAVVPLDACDGLYARAFAGRTRLVYTGNRDWVRQYAWS